jgi:uncharacterized protein YrrD
MLRSYKELRGFAIRATDSHIGRISDVYFDDRDWRVRYCVVDSGRWFSKRHVLIGTRPLSVSDFTRRELWVRLSKTEVTGSRTASTDKPVSKHGFDPHLRSCNAVIGHRLNALDGKIGRVADFLFDEKAWVIRHLIVDTENSNLPAGSRVLVDPRHVTGVCWPNASVSIDLSRLEAMTSPIPAKSSAVKWPTTPP